MAEHRAYTSAVPGSSPGVPTIDICFPIIVLVGAAPRGATFLFFKNLPPKEKLVKIY